jgi:putative methionine-R-sulfoxide reductase with GAF domain
VTEKSVARAIARAVDNEAPREQRARRAAEIVRDARGYRRVGIYDVGDEEVALIGYAESGTRANSNFPISQGLSFEVLRTRATVIGGSEAITPILGAESGIVIGTLNAKSDRSGGFSDDDAAFLEECAAALRPLYE